MKSALILQQVQDERSEELDLCLLQSLSKHQDERSEELDIYCRFIKRGVVYG